MTTDQPYIPFSQRVGLEPVPPQLKHGEVSADLRRLLGHHIEQEIERHTRFGPDSAYLSDNWKHVARDLDARLLKAPVFGKYPKPGKVEQRLLLLVRKSEVGSLLNLIEFLVRHSKCSDELKANLAEAFVEARSSYRIIDGQFVEMGSEQQQDAFLRALADADLQGVTEARGHLIDAGVALRNADWKGSVRESIHAVEAMALRLAPGEKTLSQALNAIERKGHLHGGLKAGFNALYGYSSDERGIRHSMTDGEAQVDEVDAIFMLGACASFVSYLLARSK
ncbi:MAG: hypothetical protein AAF483_24780 [Planctomycetota bacterium]